MGPPYGYPLMDLRAGETRARKFLGVGTNDMDAEPRLGPSQANLEMTGSGVYPLHR